MYLVNFFILRKNTPANIAKKRLKIIVAKQRSENNNTFPHYLPQLKRDIMQVICKYTQINSKKISIQFQKKNNHLTTLELNIILNEAKK